MEFIKKIVCLAVLATILVTGSCVTITKPAKTPMSPPTTDQGQQENMSGLSFKHLVERYAEWRKQGVSVREALCRLPHVGRVYTIDDYHTAIRVLRNPVSYEVDWRCEKEIMALGVAYGGKPYILVRDSLTGRMVPYRNVKIRDNKDFKGIHWVDLATGKKNYDFLYQGKTGGLSRLRLECGEMKIVQVLTVLSSDGTWRYLDTMILEHPTRQPFAYKTPNLPPPYSIPKTAPGGKLDELGLFKGKTKFSSILKGFFNTNKAFVEEDKIEYVLAICHNEGGKARWVVSKPPETQRELKKNAAIRNSLGFQWVTGKLVEVTPLDGWVYATTDQRSTGVRPEWYLGCEAVQPFVLRGFYRQTRGGGGWWYDEYLYPGRQITEIKFKPLEASAPAETIAKELQSSVARMQPGGERDPLARTIALNTARTTNPIVQTVGPTRYESSFNGRDSQGCAIVSVTRFSDTTAQEHIPALETIFNYRVCERQVEPLGITTPQAVRKDVLDQLPEFAKTCQRYGETRMRTVNYVLYCRPLRGESQCDVEISVLKQGRMIKKFLYDGCTGRKIK